MFDLVFEFEGENSDRISTSLVDPAVANVCSFLPKTEMFYGNWAEHRKNATNYFKIVLSLS